MSSSALSATAAQTPEQALAGRIGQIDFSFRNQVKARIEELSKQAGVDALDFLLHPEKTSSEQSARAAKSRSDAIAEGLQRYIAACRNYHDVQGALNTVRGVAEAAESISSYQRDEAEAHALKELTGTANEVGDGRQRKMALNSLHRAEGTAEFVQLLRKAFAPVMNEDL